jgi:ABC-type transport system involved in multi-copper enzyme maturation permease subunit
MTNSLLVLLLVCPIYCLILLAAVAPWLAGVDPAFFRARFGSWKGLLTTVGATVGLGLVAAIILNANNEPAVLSSTGRVYAFLLQLQLGADGLVLFLFVLLKLWPKAGAVALAAFREGVRQPMFWILLIVGVLLLGLSPFLPYFTFGEDLKMIQDLGYITIMFSGTVFGVLAASMSIAEEIEGRTAVTVMSKPISRRNFLLGKFAGILLAAMVMTMVLAFLMVWIIIFYDVWQPPLTGQPAADPNWVTQLLSHLWLPGPSSQLFRGVLLWSDVMGAALPGFLLTFCQTMVLTAIAVALATRVPMIVNILVCLAVYFLGHLTPILTAISQAKSITLIAFLAQLFNYVLPGLDLFDMGPAVVRYQPLSMGEFGLYALNVTLYAVIYTSIALLFGLFLFEDRDLA